MSADVKNFSEAGEQKGSGSMARIVDRNIEALLARRQAEEKQQGWEERVPAAITRFTGSMLFVYIHVFFFGGWIGVNLGWIPFLPKFDTSFVILAMVASVEAIFLSTFVLITQNRMQAAAEKRAELQLQVNLLAEHEVTRILSVLTELSKRMNIETAKDPELQELAQDVRPEQVLDKIEERESSFLRESKGNK